MKIGGGKVGRKRKEKLSAGQQRFLMTICEVLLCDFFTKKCNVIVKLASFGHGTGLCCEWGSGSLFSHCQPFLTHFHLAFNLMSFVNFKLFPLFIFYII